MHPFAGHNGICNPHSNIALGRIGSETAKLPLSWHGEVKNARAPGSRRKGSGSAGSKEAHTGPRIARELAMKLMVRVGALVGLALTLLIAGGSDYALRDAAREQNRSQSLR